MDEKRNGGGRERYWTRDRIIDAIQRFYQENGRAPKVTDFAYADHENNYPHFTTLYRRRTGKRNRGAPFKNLSEAVRAAKLPKPPREVVRYSSEEILQMFENLVQKLGHVPTSNEYTDERPERAASLNTIGRHFGGWHEFLQAWLAWRREQASYRGGEHG